MARATRLLRWIPAAVLGVLLTHSSAQAVLLEFTIDERDNRARGPFNLIFTRGEVVLCDGAIKGRRDGCADAVVISDIITFTAVMQQGSSWEMKSLKDPNDPDPDPADVDGPLKPVTDNIVYLVEPPAGAITYTPAEGEPGFIRLSDNTSTFRITSDVPGPGTLLFLLSGLVALAGAKLASENLARRQVQKTRATAIQGHMRASGQRRQARRDSR